jgi:hypothetical protein
MLNSILTQTPPGRIVSLIAYPNNEVRLRAVSNCQDRSRSRDSRLLVPPESSLGIRCENGETPNEVHIRSGWGAPSRKTRFGLNARRSLLRGGGALAKLGLGPGRCSFLTLTCPGSSDSAVMAWNSWNGYIRDRVATWLYDRGITFWMNVWEWQCGRLEKFAGRPALHFHCCIGSFDEEVLRAVEADWGLFVQGLALDVCEKSHTDIFERHPRKGGGSWRHVPEVMLKGGNKAERCKKDPAAYLSKYMSKDARSIDADLASRFSGLFDYPSRWWGMSADLRAAVRSMTYVYKVYCQDDDIPNILASFDDLFRGVITARYTYPDKYNPGNLNVIYYLDSETWEGVAPEINSGFMRQILSDFETKVMQPAPLPSRAVIHERAVALRQTAVSSWNFLPWETRLPILLRSLRVNYPGQFGSWDDVSPGVAKLISAKCRREYINQLVSHHIYTLLTDYMSSDSAFRFMESIDVL